MLAVYTIDKYSHKDSRRLSKVHDDYVLPQKIKKMRVNRAARIFSHDVAEAMKNYAIMDGG